MNAISLFSCIGVGEFYLKALGINVVVASELEQKRCDIYNYFYPETQMICGDIRVKDTKDKIVNAAKAHDIDLVIATPPCQGMSSVGKNRKDGTLHHDLRNGLILETFDIIDSLKPNYILIENVPRFLKVNYGDKSIIDILEEKYGEYYSIKHDVFNTADFGVPQVRNRLFIRLSKKGLIWKEPVKINNHISLREAIGNLPTLEAGLDSGIKNHWARKHPDNHIQWMKNTPTGETAFNNVVHYPSKKDGTKIKGYKNCYRRIEWDKPAPTVTMRNEIISSQNNVHPGRLLEDGTWSDARVLTLRELLIISSLPPDLDLPSISDTTLRQLIGEGIPSLMMRKILEGIKQ